MIRLRHSARQVDLEGSRRDLKELCDQIVKFTNAQEGRLEVEAETGFDPAPYKLVLRSLVVVKSSGAFRAGAVGDILHLQATPDLLAVFANNLPCSAGHPQSGIRYHVHFDACSRPGIVDPESDEIILSLKGDG